MSSISHTSSTLNGDDEEFDVNLRIDTIINQLLSVTGPNETEAANKVYSDINVTSNDASFMCHIINDILLNEPSMLEISAPITIVGDIHGQFIDLLIWFEKAGYPPNVSYLFLGDYVDRGMMGVETICLLFAFKIKYPHKMYLLRGNHESAKMNQTYGFLQECRRRYNYKVWRLFVNCFDCLPVAALINNKIFCCHGGLSPYLYDLNQIREIERPTDVPDEGLLHDLLWSDPEGNGLQGFKVSKRIGSYAFGTDVVLEFVSKNNLLFICRAHQVVSGGVDFFADNKLVTIFSAPNYCGILHNTGAIMNVDENLEYSFITASKFANSFDTTCQNE